MNNCNYSSLSVLPQINKRILTFAINQRINRYYSIKSDLIKSFTYRAFGLIISSEIECPELIITKGEPNVFVKFGEAPISLNNPLFSGVRFQTSGQEFLLTVDKIACYHVENGNSIVIDPFPNADISDIRLFLLGSAFGAIIHQRGLLPFHGSSLRIGDSAIILSGLSGAGKSTLAAAFLLKGYKLLSDDVSVVSFDANGNPIVYPGYPQMKLWSDSMLKLGKDPMSHAKVRQKMEKHYVPATDNFWDRPIPLKNIFVIVSSNLGELKIEQIRGVEKFSLLKTHTYRFNFVAGKHMQEKHFKSYEQLARKVGVLKLTRPSGKFLFDDLIKLVLENNG